MLALLLTTSLAAATPVTGDMTPQQLGAEIRNEGAKAVVDRLSRSGQWWTLTRHIADGSPEWIALAPALSTGTDAGTSESLKISLAYALPKATSSTLDALDAGSKYSPRSIQEVCSSPFLEDSREHERSYKLVTLAALKRIDAPRLHKIAAACADELRKVR